MIARDHSAKGIQSIEVGFRLLEAFEAAAGPLSLKALAAAAGMSPSKAHFYLTSLARVGFVAQAAPGGLYEFGPAAIRFGIAALSQLDVTQLARPHMFDLRAETGEAVFLSVWGTTGPTILLRIEGQRWAPLEIRVGATLKTLSATGRALIAWLPEYTIDELLERGMGELSPSDPWHGFSLDQARTLLSDVRENGYALGTGSTAGGFHGVAAPIFDAEGSTPAAITLVGSDSSFRVTSDSPKLAALLNATQLISAQLGAPRARPAASVIPIRPKKAKVSARANN